jgi:ubiquinone/menaquinone biosynthesis C-methylase UbiE
LPGRVYEATWGRLFAAGYDWIEAGSERAGMRERRVRVLAGARGRTLEVGAGTGLNLAHYPEGAGEIVLAEPDPHMAKRLRARVARAGRSVRVVDSPGERLPFDDGAFDTVVVTLVLCTVPDPPAVLREIARVLAPGGRLLFLEHVRSEDPRIARRQDRLEGPWRLFGHGCHCNRDTLAALRDSPLAVEEVERGEVPKAPTIVRPLIAGTARAA